MASIDSDTMEKIGTAMPPSILVLSLGNEMLRDRGIGIHVVRQLTQKEWPSTVSFLQGGTLGAGLGDILRRYDGLIIIDTADLQALPGTIRTYEGNAMKDFVTSISSRTAKPCQLTTIVSEAEENGYLPALHALAVVQPEDESWGTEPVDGVAAAIPEICKWVEGVIRRWQS